MSYTKPRVLAIDDTPSNLLTLGAALADDFDLQIATSGAIGIGLARQTPPDLILLDMLMPGMDGFETCRRLKLDPLLKHIPVIFVTAVHQLEEQEEGFALGAVDYITKPFQIPLILARINVHVRLKLKCDMLETLATHDKTHPHWVLKHSPRQLIPPGFPPIELSAQDYTVLNVLATADGQVSRKVLVDALGRDFFSYDQRSLNTQMHRLRSKVEQACGIDLPVSTLRGVGYHFHAAIEVQK